jgi:membrane protein implicated in regulation of membrane protease activity
VRPSHRSRAGDAAVAAAAILLALLANAANFFLAGFAAGPIALGFAAYGLWRCRGWTRAVSLVAALLSVAAFVISVVALYGLSHGSGESRQRSPQWSRRSSR